MEATRARAGSHRLVDRVQAGPRPRRTLARRAAIALAALAVATANTASSSIASAPASGAPSCQGQAWREAWASAPTYPQRSFSDQSLRLVLTPLRSGNIARVRLSNRFGTQPITFGSVYIGEQRNRASLVPGSNRRVRFDARRQVTIAAGHETLSDPVRISFQALDHLAVSVYVTAPGGPATEHWPIPGQTSFESASASGDLAAQEKGTGFSTSIDSWPFVTGIETRLSRRDGVVVAVGDAVTQGLVASPLGGLDIRYTNFLARRLDARPHGPRFSVLNEGVGGNFLLRDALLPWNGPSLLARLRADVLARPGVTDVILLSGLVDLGIPPFASADAVISGLQSAVHRMKRFRHGGRRHLNVLVGTLTPSGGATLGPGLFPPETNIKRNEINRYIRHSGIGDGYVAFAQALRDPDHPGQLLPRYDSGDHLHPSSAGFRRMAREVTLSELKGTDCR